MPNYTTAQLSEALKVQRKIESHQKSIDKLTGTLSGLLEGGGGNGVPAPFTVKKQRGRRKMSDAVKARLAKAAKLRWKKAKAAGKNRL
jgi:hypothetical protein